MIELQYKKGDYQQSLKAMLETGFQPGNTSWLSMTILQDSEKSEEYFCLQMHHCLYDGWSMGLYMNDFIQSYSTKQVGQGVDFKPYIQYIQTRSEVLDEFWYLYLQDLKPSVLFSTKTRSEDWIPIRWDVPLNVEKLQIMNLCQRFQVTESSIFKTLLGLVFQMYTQTDDVVFGEVVSGRDVPVPGIDQVGGPTISTIPTRIQCASSMKLQDLFTKIEKEHISRFEYSAITISKLEELIADSNEFLRPLKDDDALQWTEISFPFEIQVDVTSQGVKVNCSVQNNEWKSLVDQMMLQLQVMLLELCNITSEIATVGDVVKLPSDMKHQLLQWGTGEQIPLVVEYALEPFLQIAKNTPDLQALEQGDMKMSYGELHQYSSNLKNYLIEKGVKNGDFVPLITSRCFGMIIGMFGILKAGAAYIPIDNSMPLERIQTILEEAGVKHVLIDSTTNKEILEFCGDKFQTIVLSNELWERSTVEQSPNRLVKATDPAYVVFTSGSTGKPKGVVVSHFSLVNYATTQVPKCAEMFSRWGNLVSINFDMNTSDVFLTTLNSCCLVLKSSENFDVLKKIQSCVITPSLLKLLDPLDFNDLKQLIVAGESIPFDLLSKWENSVTFINGYGPSEATCLASTSILNDKSLVTIGKPLPNTVQYIVNERLELVPAGVKGELLIGGAGVAIGYLNRPDLTAEKFLPNHFLNDGSRMYRTGDVCRWTEDGEIEIMGRSDDQVKVNGYRIELNEVRDNLEFVDSAEVLKIDNKLVAFVTPDTVNVEKVLEAAMEKLPHYMIPSLVVPLKQFPLTGNGKVFYLIDSRLTRKLWLKWISASSKPIL